jgi:hypothetical protein
MEAVRDGDSKSISIELRCSNSYFSFNEPSWQLVLSKIGNKNLLAAKRTLKHIVMKKNQIFDQESFENMHSWLRMGLYFCQLTVQVQNGQEH